MTSEVTDSKTNEFLRRRKLRLQQVREQSKDIAKKVRQRAKVENLRQVVEIDSKKQKEYLRRQEKLVKQLEEYYARGIENVGASHRNASEVRLRDDQGDKVDLSKQRGKEATAEIRKRRQQVLDNQKRLLDRKLHAREAANEISRDKSAAVVNKLQSKLAVVSDGNKDINTKNGDKNDRDVAKTDMATQWDLEEMPDEWEPNIPTLSLPKDDNSLKESNNNNVDSKSDKSRRLDLFAVSDEMPSSLLGGLTNLDERVPVKTSLTLVSEYLQNRGLRLRETDATYTSKKVDDLQGLKQTILRTRASKEGTNVCHVHDEELVPVPSWHAEQNTECNASNVMHKQYEKSIKRTNVMQSAHNVSALRAKSAHREIPNAKFSARAAHNMPNKTFNSIRPAHPDLLASPVLRGNSPVRRNKVCWTNYSAKDDNVRPVKSGIESSAFLKKSSVTMYNHATRDSRDIPYEEERLVVRDSQDDDDAYSQAMKETNSRNAEKNHHKKIEEIRSKVAMTKQNVEKEYRDTMSFLNALPKDKGNKSIKTAFMNDQRQQSLKGNRQLKLQHEYRKIEKECKKPSTRVKPPKKPRSPLKGSGDVFESSDIQYSWMPVPESDGNLAIHTIPTTLKEGKSTNAVKFSKVDSYHEYRSRHKHTPPTKDTVQDRSKTHIETVGRQSLSDTESDSSGSPLRRNETADNEKLSDAEKIIIYKILDSKPDKANSKKTTKLMKNIAKSLSLINEQKQNNEDNNDQRKRDENVKSSTENIVSFEQLNEGVYKTVNENGDNITSMYFHNIDDENTEKAPDKPKLCKCTKGLCRDCGKRTVTDPRQWESGDKPPTSPTRSRNSCGKRNCKCDLRIPSKDTSVTFAQPTTTSSGSFKTPSSNYPTDGGFIKLIDDGGQEAGKFYIGASGLLKNDAYEVVIQVRKKSDEKEDKTKKEDSKSIDAVTVNATQTCMEEVQETNNTEPVPTVSVEKEPSQEKIESVTTCDPVVNIQSDIQTNQNLKNTISISTNGNDFEQKDTHFFEKGICTEFQDEFLLNTSKSQPRPATSTYTQTSFSNNRPIYFHMSSSTSTAYMSPPETILPKFLKRDHQCTDTEDIFYSRNDTEEVDYTEIHEYSDRNNCKCKDCTHATKVILNKHARAPQYKLSTPRNAKTPPNTARSLRSSADKVKEIYVREDKITETTHSKNKSKCSRHDCDNHISRKHKHVGSNSVCHKNSRNSAKHLSRNMFMQAASSAASSKKETHSTFKGKTNLKPIIKNYVDKLLMLNKINLKAINVINQDCSSVATPGSSIIDVPHNIDERKPVLENKLSLEQLRSHLIQSVMGSEKYCKRSVDLHNQDIEECLKKQTSRNNKQPKVPRRKTTHKIKSLNISKKMSRPKKSCGVPIVSQNNPMSFSPATKREFIKIMSSTSSRSKCRSKSYPTPRLTHDHDTAEKSVNQNLTHGRVNNRQTCSQSLDEDINKPLRFNSFNKIKDKAHQISQSSIPATPASTTLDSDKNPSSLDRNNVEIPMSISTQTSINVDTEINFIKLAEGKLQNMEKIADLTEKCTKRLSNLAKVLEEVRKNKTLAYSQISTSDTTSDSDQKSDKNVCSTQAPLLEPLNNANKASKSALFKTSTLKEDNNTLDSTDYIPLLSNIPKPVIFKSLNTDFSILSSSSSSKKSNTPSPVPENGDHSNKTRGKPPPALSRIHSKLGQDGLVLHELSTVVEVDSPMSVMLKSSRNETKTGWSHADHTDGLNTSNRNNPVKSDECTRPRLQFTTADISNNPDLLDSNLEISNAQRKNIATESSVNSRVQMIDIKQFNEIMLKPFFSIQEYAQQCNGGALDDGSNLDDMMKDDQINDELSSLHSEASLPDVISELLKRNIISEPFRFDTGSNANSTIVSSESTMSVLALSKARQVKNKSNALFQNKDSIGETSDTLSFSSNPDLENAFKKLGMGWASSTLKKTKERLALSSSSNTSNSSLSEFKVRSFNQDIPALITDTVLPSAPKTSKQQIIDSSKNAEQQTSMPNSMTVKEFLTNELAKKITFNNNKSRNETEEKFVTMYETKMPEEMKHSSLVVYEENSIDNTTRSGNNNRARTSTPVQLFKSMTYHSSSSSNISNGLFSNADDLSSVKLTSNSMKHSTSDKDDLIIPSFSLRVKKCNSDCSKSD